MACGSIIRTDATTVIPKPLSVSQSDGAFRIDHETTIVANASGKWAAAFFAERLRIATGWVLPIQDSVRGEYAANQVVFRTPDPDPALSELGQEGYRLRVASDGIDISSNGPAGLFYGAQTLLQLLPPQVFARTSGSLQTESLAVPAVTVIDRPRFRWRGLLIDVSRHFRSKAQLIKTLDAMAMHKLNVLQLHLTDNEGWRLEIESYPKLTTVGAIGDRTNPDGPERLYFSRDDIREIVAHAARHHIIVVPEIDMPGHSGAAARAYPELFDGHQTINPVSEKSFAFVKGVLAEVMELFPSRYLHFGGDEVWRDHRWADMPEVRAFMRQMGYTDFKEVEGHFDRSVTKFITDSGFTPIAWDEVAEFDVHPNTIVLWWRHWRPEARESAIRKGHRVIISPANYLYFDYPNAPGEPGAPWIGNDNGPNSFQLIHQWEPIPESFSAEEEAQVLGLQANVWTEFIRSNQYYEYMIFPRLSALAEIAWSPKGEKDLNDFKRRLLVQCQRYEALGLNYRPIADWPTEFPYLTH